MDVLTQWAVPIVVALIAGGFSYLGVVKSVKASYNEMLFNIRSEHDKLAVSTGHQINNLKEDISRLEQKQDKHNAVIERTYKLEQKVDDLEKRIN